MTHDRVLEHLARLPTFDRWPEMQAILRRAAVHKDPNWELPVLACRATGGNAQDAIAAAAAVACLQISIILIDDILDHDPRGEHHRLGLPVTLNLAAAFQSAASLALTTSQASSAAIYGALQSLGEIGLLTAFGQHLDAQNLADEESYWQVVKTKSAPFFGGAFEIGALLGGAEAALAHQLKSFGQLYGEIIQIYDDLRDTLATPASPDWMQGRWPLPILYAATMTHLGRTRFCELKSAWADPAALREAQDILIRCGAVSYCVHAILTRCAEAEQMLDTTTLAHRDPLDRLLLDLRRPVENLLATVAIE